MRCSIAPQRRGASSRKVSIIWASYQARLRKPVTLPGSGILIDTFKLTGTGAADGLSTLIRGRVPFDSAARPDFTKAEILEVSGQPSGCDPL